jgi:DNA transposition AAA+ family ATPase
MPLYDQQTELTLERLRRLMDGREQQGRPISLADLAKSLGVSTSQVSYALNRKYDGDIVSFTKRLRAFVEREEAKNDGGLLQIPFAETRQAKMFQQAYGFVSKYNRLGVVIGVSGYGKTRTIKELHKEDPGMIVVHAWKGLRGSGVLQELCDAIKESDRGLLRGLMKRIKSRLEGSGRTIIVDDAHTLDYSALDVLRHVYDTTGVGLLLVGISTLQRYLVGHTPELEQLASRVSGRVWTLPELTREDVRLILSGILEEDLLDEAMRVLAADPQLLSSARRVNNFLEIAGKFATTTNGSITLDHIRKAMKLAA